MTYVTHIEDASGDLVDILVYCGESCASAYTRLGTADFFDSPCYEPGGHAYCANCGESVKHGANCYAALTNELTDECPEAAESENTCEARDYECCEQLSDIGHRQAYGYASSGEDDWAS